MTHPNLGAPIPTPAELEGLRIGVAGWDLAVEVVAAWRAQDPDRGADACEALLLADTKRAAYALYALGMIVNGLLDDLAQPTARSPDYVWASYASAPSRMRAAYGLAPDGES